MTQSLATRYNALLKRSFARHLDLFLTVVYLRRGDGSLANISSEEYGRFQPTADERDSYLLSQQARKFSEPFTHNRTVQDLDTAIKHWRAANKVLEDQLRPVHNQQHCLNLDDFHDLVSRATGELACEYCALTESEFRQLFDHRLIRTKRLSTRGSTFEFDCREPEHGYTKDNVALCCYWCNNAKTDEFTPAEFKPMATAMAAIWRQRLASKAVVEPAL